MSKQFTQTRKYLYSHPWAIQPEALAAIVELFEAHISGEADLKAGQLEQMAADREKAQKMRMVDGVAVVPISGPILKGATVFDKICGATSPQMIKSQFNDALDSDASAIMFLADSPGGSGMGIPELATYVHEQKQKTDKPVIGLAEGLAASACYWILSQSDAMYATEGSPVGSIGVYAATYDDTRMMQNAGIDPVVIRSHELKGIGAGPITANQKDALQAMVGKHFEMFKAAVTRGRPGMDVEPVANGLTWFGKEAVDLGLVDGITTFDALIDRYGNRA